MKLQVLHPIAGVAPTPLFSAKAAFGADATATAIMGTPTSAATAPRSDSLMCFSNRQRGAFSHQCGDPAASINQIRTETHRLRHVNGRSAAVSTDSRRADRVRPGRIRQMY